MQIVVFSTDTLQLVFICHVGANGVRPTDTRESPEAYIALIKIALGNHATFPAGNITSALAGSSPPPRQRAGKLTHIVDALAKQ